jgi:hypothetical protein
LSYTEKPDNNYHNRNKYHTGNDEQFVFTIHNSVLSVSFLYIIFSKKLVSIKRVSTKIRIWLSKSKTVRYYSGEAGLEWKLLTVYYLFLSFSFLLLFSSALS